MLCVWLDDIAHGRDYDDSQSEESLAGEVEEEELEKKD